MALTRRQLLVSAGALGASGELFSRAVPLPLGRPRGSGLRLGLLQSAEPFIDVNDLPGSRQRALTAFQLLLERSVREHGPLDWMVGGAYPLSGAGPFAAPMLRQLALDQDSIEVRRLAGFARARGLRITLGAWWWSPGDILEPKLLMFESDGSCRALPSMALQKFSAVPGLHLQLPTRHGAETEQFAAQCSRLGVYGGRIETTSGPSLPPGARSAMGPGTLLISPAGDVLMSAPSREETCLVVELPV